MEGYEGRPDPEILVLADGTQDGFTVSIDSALSGVMQTLITEVQNTLNSN